MPLQTLRGKTQPGLFSCGMLPSHHLFSSNKKIGCVIPEHVLRDADRFPFAQFKASHAVLGLYWLSVCVPENHMNVTMVSLLTCSHV